jgi:hypothetical protein
MAETMAGATTVAARGKVTALKDGVVRFTPSGTNYELHLLVAPGFAAAAGRLVQGSIRVQARKVWTVPSGGNFISPIFGPPRTIQGRVRSISDREIVVHAGTSIVVDLPAQDTGYDLASGPIAVGAIVNVVAMPGARFEPVTK